MRQHSRDALPAWALAVLLAGPALAEGLEAINGEASIPDHGGCTFFSPGQPGRFDWRQSEDLRAMTARAKATRDAMALIPEPRSSPAPFRLQTDARRVGADAMPCEGIDDCVQQTAEAVGIPLANLTTDAEFLRRVRLDLTGRIPTRHEVVRFLADPSDNKRQGLVDSLLGMPEWADRWALFFGDLFRNTVRTDGVNRRVHGRDSLHLYLLESLRANKPYDRMAREMLAAEGTSDGREYPDSFASFEDYERVYGDLQSNPVRASPVGYVVGARTPGGPPQDTYDALAYRAARDFLGMSTVDCVLCHDGEGRLDGVSAWGARATRLEVWGLAAFFSDLPPIRKWTPRVSRESRRVPVRYFVIQDRPSTSGDIDAEGGEPGRYLAWTQGGNRPDRRHDERRVAPAYPFAALSVDPQLRLREQVGFYLTSDLQFARAAVNYIWREFFARGLVEPADQFDPDRLDPAAPPAGAWEVQPSHPRLLEWLANGFRANGFDLKWLMREIVTSQTYQLSSRYDGVFNPQYERLFVRHNARRLSAEQIHDAIVIASGKWPSYDVSPTLQDVGLAMQFPDVNNVIPGRGRNAVGARNLLWAFLPGDRRRTPRSGAASPLQALNLMNNIFVLRHAAYSASGGALAELIPEPDDALVTGMYLSVLGRPPRADELAMAVAHLGEGPNRRRRNRAEDLMWALLNRTEFYTNY
ncbi:MAG: DUF1553 domain-containing protein [Bryobacterales bacterium]|nr:DUF1553 domain-containing protein [Bryobacterales bacterium]